MLILCIVQNKSIKSNCFSGVFERKERKKETKRFPSSSPHTPYYLSSKRKEINKEKKATKKRAREKFSSLELFSRAEHQPICGDAKILD